MNYKCKICGKVDDIKNCFTTSDDEEICVDCIDNYINSLKAKIEKAASFQRTTIICESCGRHIYINKLSYWKGKHICDNCRRIEVDRFNMELSKNLKELSYNEIDSNNLLNFARIIKAFCSDKDCENCPFWDRITENCEIADTSPNEWF